MESTETAIQTLKELKSMGVRISIDDLGTGYSSLSYPKCFPIDTLKIDRSFVRDVTSDPDDKAIINAIIALARSLNLEVIAEGVETIQQLVCLHEQGSDGMQGYLFSPPLPIDSLTQLLKEGKISKPGGSSPNAPIGNVTVLRASILLPDQVLFLHLSPVFRK